MQPTIHVLVLEDESTIADTIVYALRSDGMRATHVTLGQEALQLLRDDDFHLAIFDVGLPDANGFDLCRQLRRFSDIPVIFLTARAEEIDRIVGLEIGADDYVTKPFSPRELVARVRVVLRRGSTSRSPSPITASQNGFRIDEAGQRIYWGDHPLDLTRYEYHLLRTFLQAPGRIFTRGDLMQRIWSAPDHSMERTVDAHIKTLRAKVRAASRSADPIQTHRGLGYAWRLEP